MNTRISTLFLFISITFFQACSQKETVVEENREFDEQFRPQYHFSPPANWMNDPNGMVYFEGEYHLFYQYYPDGNVWGPMHWGHAISTDLIHWEHLPIAIYPDDLGWIFSGSAVVDWENTSGLGTGNQPPMIAIYTYHLDSGEKAGRDDYQTQGIAYSNDKGRTWTKYENNPVLANPGIKDFRDPKVTWHEESESWIMSLAVKDKISFYTSSNLLEWTYQSDFNPDWAAYGGVWECPDLFPITTDSGEEKWILLVSINPGGPNGGSATQYFVGDFDGRVFTTETTEVKWLDYGADNYAGVTWSDVPKEDGRRLFLGWMSNWLYANEVPTEVWRSAMTVPRSLELMKNGDDYSIASRPVEELEKLRESTKEQEGDLISLTSDVLEIEMKSLGGDFKMTFSNDQGDKLVIDKTDDLVLFDRSQAGLKDFSDVFATVHNVPLKGVEVKDIRIFLDRSSIEIFFNDGESVITELIFPTSAYTELSLQGMDSKVEIHLLKSIWGN
ncbi:beta-fructosidase, levanase/invertase [Belliella baltica DSM 15883]|uniref:Beta-fructosidase, levanase/invertase n=1 Tax=Belliella baltica (strain DSM 15883 / CIP 108006 / LMG 21964 / BA134) TaxID=866536 RepID=I3ZA14_BELBD|nr:glycoside hydrolase family 32 protein [Belliella baltica]AFL86082.1 beta-fructosidase, levanase/invertase [Belliella baltica DSM 15883]